MQLSDPRVAAVLVITNVANRNRLLRMNATQSARPADYCTRTGNSMPARIAPLKLATTSQERFITTIKWFDWRISIVAIFYHFRRFIYGVDGASQWPRAHNVDWNCGGYWYRPPLFYDTTPVEQEGQSTAGWQITKTTRVVWFPVMWLITIFCESVNIRSSLYPMWWFAYYVKIA